MKRVTIDKRGSVTAAISVATQALLSTQINSREGELIAARVTRRSQRYGSLEDVHGRQVEVYEGDVVVGALGQRHALHGHGGVIPETLAVGDTLHMLNLGGVMGICHTSNPMVGPPTELEVLGSVLTFPVVGSREGLPANLNMSPHASVTPIDAASAKKVPPLIIVSGTCMNAGKTFAACAIVRAFVQAGLKVDAAKFTGVAAKKDVMAMVDCGAARSMTFVDVGLPSTTRASAPHAAKQLLHILSTQNPAADAIIVELGDGLLGAYGVMEILEDPIFRTIPAVHVCCASDPVGTFGAMTLFEARLGKRPDMFTGPVTDNRIGCEHIEKSLKTPAFNALEHSTAFGDAVLGMFEKLRTPGASS